MGARAITSELFRLEREVDIQQAATQTVLAGARTGAERQRVMSRSLLLDEASICIAQARRADSRRETFDAERRHREALDVIAKALEIEL